MLVEFNSPLNMAADESYSIRNEAQLNREGNSVQQMGLNMKTGAFLIILILFYSPPTLTLFSPFETRNVEERKKSITVFVLLFLRSSRFLALLKT